jgi:hypothetical protein
LPTGQAHGLPPAPHGVAADNVHGVPAVNLRGIPADNVHGVPAVTLRAASADNSSSRPPTDHPEGRAEGLDDSVRQADHFSARRVIFWLFVALAIATAVSLYVFVETPMGKPFGPVVYRVLAGDLAAPVLVWFLLAGIGERGPWRWFWFSAAVPAALATMAIVLLALMGLDAV